MKRTYATLLLSLILVLPGFSAEIESLTYNNLVAGISRVREPLISGKYIIFTASGSARFAGIAFEHEKFGKTWPFRRIVKKDEMGLPQKDASGKPLDSILFYIAEIPPDMSEIRYRVVIDGLWTTDPQNPSIIYDYENGMNLSRVAVEKYEIFATSNINKGQVRFTYEGKTGSVIRLAGSFNGWDPFMYEMVETDYGKYELVLPLPPGKWFYAYFEGTTQLRDTTNSERVYTKDGRVASVVVVE
jgi:hypothetical protein